MVEDEIPAGWVACKLGEIIELSYGKSLPAKARDASGSFDVYGSNGRVGVHSSWLVKAPAVIVGRKGSAGAVHLAKRNCWPIDTTYFVAENSAYDLAFAFHLLKSLQLEELDRSTAIPGLNRDDAYALRVNLPPLAEQQRIVEKIETLFAEIEKGEEALREVQKLLSRYRQSVLKAAVTGKLIGKGSADWTPVVLGDLLEDIRYGTAKKCWPDGEGTAVLRIPNVVGGEVDLTDLKFTSLTKKELEKLSLREGDILIVRSNGSANLVGRGAIVASDAVGMAYAGYLIRLRLDRKRITPEFLQIVLSSPQIRGRIERQAKSTSGVHNLNSAETKAIAFDLPDLATQAAVVEAVDEALSRVAHGEAWCETELKRSAALRWTILKDAFSGRLVPQDPSDEPAEKLLQRIRATGSAKIKPIRSKVPA